MQKTEGVALLRDGTQSLSSGSQPCVGVPVWSVTATEGVIERVASEIAPRWGLMDFLGDHISETSS